MKKPKTVVPFYFKITESEMKDILKNTPISLKYSIDLINRVCDRYKILPKNEVIEIIKCIFEVMRESLLLGDILNLNKFCFDTKLFFFQRTKNGVIVPRLRVKVGTPIHFNKIK